MNPTPESGTSGNWKGTSWPEFSARDQKVPWREWLIPERRPVTLGRSMSPASLMLYQVGDEDPRRWRFFEGFQNCIR